MIRVLFVDDEPRILDGLRRSLRRQRGAWSMSFVEGGPAAIEALDHEEFDVVVSDTRMPQVDGFEVLCHARDVQPDAMRIVLSGQTELETALRSVPVAHQFLSKPCDAGQVKSIIERASQMRELFRDQTLRETVSRAGSLPSCPELYLKLTDVLRDPDAGAADVAAIVEQDIGMCAKILQIVNSAFFGLPREVTTVRDAIAYLGVKLIRAIVLREEAFRPFEGKGAFTQADLAAEQRRGLLVGNLARKLIGDPVLAEQAFLAGMLHDIGWVIVGTMLPEAYQRAVAEDCGEACEREVLGSTHGEIGAYLLGTWGLPLPVVEAVAFHHDPLRVEHEGFDVLTAVHVASALAAELDPASADRAPALDEEYVARLGFGERVAEWRQIAEQFGAATGSGDSAEAA